MEHESRVRKSILNARVNLFYYFLFLVLSLFSRKTFLDCLGADFIGLSGTLVEILGVLSLAEMGVGAAVAYHLYKPIESGNKKEIEALVSIFGYLYRKIGVFILVAAIIISCFIPLFFKNTIFSLGLIYFAFFSILLSSLLSYFINYRQILLSADQRGYVVTTYTRGAMFVKILIQMAVAAYLHNYYLWLALEIANGLFTCIILNWKIKQVYPWMHATVSKGKSLYPQYKHLITFTKQVFVHKIKDFLLMRSDQILIFAFVSLKMVAYYGNYTLIISRVSDAFNSALGSFGAGVGNLVAEGNQERSMSVFWELVSVRFIVAGFLIFSVYNLIEPFIGLWLGEQFILDNTILILLMINILIMQTRGAVDMFNGAYGHYADTWAAWAEGLLNIGVTLATAPFFGIAGILLGKIVSLFLIVVLWKPHYLFRDGFKVKVSYYWYNIVFYYGITIICIIVGTYFFRIIPINENASFLLWTLKAIVTIIPFTVIYVGTLCFFTRGTQDFVARMLLLIKDKFKTK